MKEIIQQIHDSLWKGHFIENGCGGTTVANKLMEVAGASKTVYAAECPYDASYNKMRFNLSNHRAVSAETIYETVFSTVIAQSLKAECNFAYVSNMQIGDETNNTATHGYIGILVKTHSKCKLTLYHISIHDKKSREEYIELLSNIGLQLLAHELIGTDVKNVFTDSIASVEFYYNDVAQINSLRVEIPEMMKVDNKKLINFFTNQTIDHCLLFYNNKQLRLDDNVRNIDEIILYKGSFNPLQNAHLAIMDLAKDFYPKANRFFVISLDTYDKGEQNTESILKRIQVLNKLGEKVLIVRKPLFLDTVQLIKNKFNGKIVLPLGQDTLNRLLFDYVEGQEKLQKDFSDCVFIKSDRVGHAVIDTQLHNGFIIPVINPHPELSSTEIRDALNKIRAAVPEAVYNDIVLNW